MTPIHTRLQQYAVTTALGTATGLTPKRAHAELARVGGEGFIVGPDGRDVTDEVRAMYDPPEPEPPTHGGRDSERTTIRDTTERVAILTAAAALDGFTGRGALVAWYRWLADRRLDEQAGRRR